MARVRPVQAWVPAERAQFQQHKQKMLQQLHPQGSWVPTPAVSGVWLFGLSHSLSLSFLLSQSRQWCPAIANDSKFCSDQSLGPSFVFCFLCFISFCSYFCYFSNQFSNLFEIIRVLFVFLTGHEHTQQCVIFLCSTLKNNAVKFYFIHQVFCYF